MEEINFETSTRDFTKACLKFNPFPTTAIPEENPSITADRDEPREKFISIVNNLRVNRTPSVSVFVGNWGSGKSHLLRVFNTAVQKKLSNIENGVFSVLIRTPGRSMLDFLKEVFSGINRTRMIQLSNQIILEYIKKNKSKVEPLVLRNYKQKFNDDNYKLDDLLEEIQINNLFKMIRNDFIINLNDEDLFYAILFLSQTSSKILAWSWIMGGTLSRSDKMKLNIGGNNDDNRKAKIMLIDLVNIILHTGYGSIIFFIDEFENIGTITANQRKIFQDDLRDIIDEFDSGTALVMAITPNVWEQFQGQTTALTRRMRSNVTILEKFNNDDIKELLQKYLKTARINDKDIPRLFPNCNPTFAPFTNSAIESILEDSEGNVSDILEDCKKCLDVFINSDEREISKKIIEKTLMINKN